MGRLDYLKQYGSANTVRSYRAALKNFFEMIYREKEPLEELAERYFSENRDFQEDVQNFFATLKELAPMTMRLKVSAIRVFLLENEVELSQRFWRRLRDRIKGSRALTLDRVPSNEELRSIVTHLPTQGRALYLTLASSGMRIGEATQLTFQDLDLNQDPVKVSIRGEYTKSGNPRIAFISREAKQAMQEWMKVRDEYLQAAAGKSHLYEKSVEDPRVFPFDPGTARIIWKNALKKSGFKKRDERTNRHVIHPHVLRKFFRTRLGKVIPVDVVEALMGHEGYLTEVYRRYSMEELAQFYKQGEYALLVFTEAAEMGKLRQEVEERNKQLQILVNGVTAENLDLKSRVSRAELEVTELQKKDRDREKRMKDIESEVKEILEKLEKLG